MIRCEICGSFFKTAQGLAGHKRFRHRTPRLTDQMGTGLTGRELHRKTINHLSEKLADQLAEALLQRHGQEIWGIFRDDLSERGFDLSSLVKYPKVKAIIVAAGESNMLLPLTKDRPNCLLQIGDRTLLSRELENLRACGIYDIAVVRGYQGDKIRYPEVRYYENRDYHNTGILSSLFHAEDEMEGEFIFCYSDILYAKQVLELLLRDQSDISLVVDTDWEQHYYQRHQHPVSQAELVRVEGDRIRQIGRNVIAEGEAHGEFIGLAKFKKDGAEALKRIYEWASQNYRGKTFHTSPSVDKANFTDLIQELIDQGYPVCHTDIQGGWAEIDTVEDFDRVSRHLQSILKIE